MSIKRVYGILSILLLSLMVSCAKPYAPSVTTTPTNYLVVEGVINTGAGDSSLIKLSRTTPLGSAQGILPEPNATVSIQDNNGASYSLTEISPGNYTTGALTLDVTKQYRLNITTADRKNYVSDLVTPEPAPAIDSIGFTVQNNGVQIYLNTHDPNNSTHYYRWDYNETWEFHSEYNSDYVTNGTAIVLRDPDQSIYKCWTSDLSNSILLGSSAKLTQDVIYQQPITAIAGSSEKIESRYSIIIRQYALTAAGYNYFNLLKQNTEELGGIFDPQPTTLTGNLHCTTDATIPVIGYITAGTIQQKRVYINNGQLPASFKVAYPYDCALDTAYINDPKTHVNEVTSLIGSPSEIIAEAIFAPGPPGPPIGYLFTDRDCADCSVRGTLTKPSFWVNGPYDQ